MTEELKSDESLKVPEPEQKPTSPMKQADVTRRTTPLEQNEKIAEGKPTVLVILLVVLTWIYFWQICAM